MKLVTSDDCNRYDQAVRAIARMINGCALEAMRCHVSLIRYTKSSRRSRQVEWDIISSRSLRCLKCLLVLHRRVEMNCTDSRNCRVIIDFSYSCQNNYSSYMFFAVNENRELERNILFISLMQYRKTYCIVLIT